MLGVLKIRPNCLQLTHSFHEVYFQQPEHLGKKGSDSFRIQPTFLALLCASSGDQFLFSVWGIAGIRLN